MPSPLGAEVDAALLRLNEVRAAGDKASKLLAETSHTSMSKRKLFSVTVGANGNLQSLTFNGENYRSLAPAELAQMIVDTVAKASAAVREEASAALNDLMPEIGTRFDRLTSGSSLEELMTGFMKAADSGFSEAETTAFEQALKADT